MSNLDIFEGCSLKEAVTLQAVEDYKKALKTLKEAERIVRDAAAVKEECETFFRSEDFLRSAPANTDGEIVIQRIKKEIGYTYED